ncbi:MAG: fibronectin type III domain-containing protein [Pseudomonadota bacterium]
MLSIAACGTSGDAGPSSIEPSTRSLSEPLSAIGFVQQNYVTPQGQQTTAAVTYAQAQSVGDLNVVVVGWVDGTSQVSSVSDAAGNSYALAVGPSVVTSSSPRGQSIYYAKNIAAAAAGVNRVNVVFNQAALHPDIRILEYSGIDPVNPIDTSGWATGNSAVSDSGNITTANANDLLVGANIVASSTVSAGNGYTQRVITSPNGNIVLDRVVTSAGNYNATANLSAGGVWLMQLVAFRAANSSGDTQAPSTPTNLAATVASNAQIHLSWVASSDNVGVTNYEIERCQNVSCSNFVRIATPSGTTFDDAGLSSSTSYSYRVRAKDAASNLSGYSTTASATTTSGTTTEAAPSGSDTQAPTIPAGFTAANIGSDKANLAWNPSSDNVGVTSYLIERCAGSNCGNFVQIGTAVTTNYSDSGLAGSTTYGYRVRATDAAGNKSDYSRQAAAITQPNSNPSSDTQAPTTPAGLAAASVASDKVNLSWNPSSDNVGVTAYAIERCTGSNCTAFAQIATTASTSFSDTGLSGSTTYGYRVRASDAAGNKSGYSNGAAATTSATSTADTQAPTAPSGLTATSIASDKVNVSWSASTDNVGVASYSIERCAGSNCTSFTQIATTTGTTFGDAGLSASTAYGYRIRATDAAGNQSGYSNSAATTTAATTTTSSSPDTQAPTIPAGFTAANIGSDKANLAWNPSSDNVGVTSYLIERCAGSNCGNFVQIGTAATTNYSDSGLAGSTTYGYRVRATDAAGNKSDYSRQAAAITQPNSNPSSDTQAPTTPAGLAAASVASDKVNLSWNPSSDNVGVTAYAIERCTGSNCTAFAQIATTASTSFSDTGLSGSTTYGYRVRASDAAGNKSGYSNGAAATTSATSTADTQAPTAPSGLTATSIASDKINLSWGASTDNVGVTSYRIERCTGSNCTGFAQVGTTSSTNFGDTGLSASTAYGYRVRAVDAAGNASGYSGVASATTQSGGSSTPTFGGFPLTPSANQRYLRDQAGNPFPILGRTSWGIINALTASDQQTYLNDTLAKGFNAIELGLITHNKRVAGAPGDQAGDLPFTKRLDGSAWDGSVSYGNINNESPDFTQPNESYWSFVDSLMSSLEQQGILALAFPAAVGYGGGSEGWMGEMSANGASRMYAYGAWIANRYKARKNIVWMMGGDYGTGSMQFSAPQSDIERAFLDGIASVASQGSLHYSAEWNSDSICTDQSTFGNRCTLNGVYSWVGQVPVYARNAYAHGGMPSFILEEPYDEEGPDGNNTNPNATQPVRRFIWWGVFQSIGGYMAGNGLVDHFDPGVWQNHLNSAGAQDLNRLNSFVRSIPWYDLVPSGLGGMNNLVTGGGSSPNSNDYVAAAATPSGTLLVAYIPPAHSGSITLDLSVMSASSRARWFNPTTANYTVIGNFPNAAGQAFSPPGDNGTGYSDWILVIDHP